MAEVANVTYSGWIVKRGGVRKTWKRRWMTLEDTGWLRYYKVQFDPRASKLPKPAGEIHLKAEAATVKNHDDADLNYEWPPQTEPKNAFFLVTRSRNRTFYFICKKNQECIQWKGHLTNWISRVDQGTGSHTALRFVHGTGAGGASPPKLAAAAGEPPSGQMRRALQITTLENESDYAEVTVDHATSSGDGESGRMVYTAVSFEPKKEAANGLEELYSVPIKKKTDPQQAYSNHKIAPKAARTAMPAPTDEGESSDSDHDERTLELYTDMTHNGPRMRAPTLITAIGAKPVYQNFVPSTSPTRAGQQQATGESAALPPKGSDDPTVPELPTKLGQETRRGIGPRPAKYENIEFNN